MGGLPVEPNLNTEEARDRAYAALVAEGLAQPAPTEPRSTRRWRRMCSTRPTASRRRAVTTAARATLDGIETRVAAVPARWTVASTGCPLASIYFLAAIGLAITFRP